MFVGPLQLSVVPISIDALPVLPPFPFPPNPALLSQLLLEQVKLVVQSSNKPVHQTVAALESIEVNRVAPAPVKLTIPEALVVKIFVSVEPSNRK